MPELKSSSDAVKITVGAAVGAAVREGTGFAVWMGKAVGCGVKGASKVEMRWAQKPSAWE